MKFIHISDLHFHRDAAKNDATLKLLKFIKEKYPDHYLIVTGDIVDDGDKKQFDRAYEALKPFIGRMFICPGNHDFGIAGNIYTDGCAERFDAMLSNPLQQNGTFAGYCIPVVNTVEDDDDKVLLIALDTNLQTKDPTDFARGEVGDGQLYALKNTVLADPAFAHHTKILFFHHHPFEDHAKLKLKDANKLLGIIQDKVDIVCFGHKHVSGMYPNRNGIRYFLASDSSPESDRFREIDITRKVIRPPTEIIWRGN